MPGLVTPHVLVVDDDPEIRSLLGRYLVEQGFRVSLAADGAELRRQLAVNAIDLIVLDILLPDGTGLTLCRELRGRDARVAIILLTALKEDVDRIIGLEIGADDYLGKPFNPRELVARIRTVLRRAQPQTAPFSSPGYRFSQFTVDPNTRTATTADGTPVALTAGEFDLLVAFLERPGRIMSRDQILDLTQSRDGDPFGRSVDVLISRLRRKLKSDDGRELFKTVRNAGYVLAVRVDAAEAD